MSRNVWIGIAVVVLVLIGWFYIQSQKSQPVASPVPQVQSEIPPATTSATPQILDKNVVTITSTGFSPQQMTVKVGESVTWVNAGSEDHQVNSAPHPTHTAYQPLNTVGLLKPGDKKSLTFPTAGTYKYHDHLNPSLFGSVTVQ